LHAKNYSPEQRCRGTWRLADPMDAYTMAHARDLKRACRATRRWITRLSGFLLYRRPLSLCHCDTFWTDMPAISKILIRLPAAAKPQTCGCFTSLRRDPRRLYASLARVSWCWWQPFTPCPLTRLPLHLRCRLLRTSCRSAREHTRTLCHASRRSVQRLNHYSPCHRWLLRHRITTRQNCHSSLPSYSSYLPFSCLCALPGHALFLL